MNNKILKTSLLALVVAVGGILLYTKAALSPEKANDFFESDYLAVDKAFNTKQDYDNLVKEKYVIDKSENEAEKSYRKAIGSRIYSYTFDKQNVFKVFATSASADNLANCVADYERDVASAERIYSVNFKKTVGDHGSIVNVGKKEIQIACSRIGDDEYHNMIAYFQLD